MDKLDKAIKSYYDEQQLPGASVDRILKLGEETALDADRNSVHRTPETLLQRMKSGLLVLAASFLIGVIVTQSYMLSRSESELVLSEIAMNHNKGLDVEFRYSDFTALESAMRKLDFRLVPPASLQSFYSLVGGRYCSIQGKLAAQLKVQDKVTGKLATLYITPVTEKLAEIKDQDVVHDNVSIRLWKNDRTFYGLAADI